jgi:hypothetical protein
VVADIDIALADVTGRARIDRSFGERRGIAGERDFGILRGAANLRDGDRGQGDFLFVRRGIGGFFTGLARQIEPEGFFRRRCDADAEV